MVENEPGRIGTRSSLDEKIRPLFRDSNRDSNLLLIWVTVFPMLAWSANA
jgi:hypothetical protein